MVRKECKTPNPSRNPPCYFPKKKLPMSSVLSAGHKWPFVLTVHSLPRGLLLHPLAGEFPTSSPSLPSTLTLYRPTDRYQQPGPKNSFLSLEKLRCQLANETGGRWLGS